MLEYRQPLVHYSKRLCGEDYEDLVQETMLRAMRSATFTGGNLRAWLFTICRNTYITGYNKRSRREKAMARVRSDARSLGQNTKVCGSLGAPPCPEESVRAERVRSRIEDAMAQLDPDQREAVELADELSYKQIAALTGVKIGTVMSRLYRGRQALHVLLFDFAREEGLVSEDAEPSKRRTKYTRTAQ